MTYWFSCLGTDAVHARWGRIRELLAPAVAKSHGELLVDDVLDLVDDGLAFVAVMGKDDEIVLAMVLNILTYPRQKVLNLAWFGGSELRYFYEHYWHVLHQFARDCGCDEMQCQCDDAMARLLLRLGRKNNEGYRAYMVMKTGVR